MLSRSCFSKATGPTTDREIHDIDCTTEIIERRRHRIRVKNTDQGREIKRHIQALTILHKAYRDDSIVLKF
ncbi:MAG: fructose-bisphosphatase class III [Desulfobacterales bacterium]|nr:fructose-bisphosphatase class III [Desulfobacterales bacterium]